MSAGRWHGLRNSVNAGGRAPAGKTLDRTGWLRYTRAPRSVGVAHPR
jgi:hypothetical protein